MFGNKYAAEELANNFQQRMSKLKSLKKQASEEQGETPASGATSKFAEADPEEFLVSPAEDLDVHSDQMDAKIKEVSSYAEDAPCGKCGKGHMAEDGCSKPMESQAEDMSYLVDRQAQYVIHELGKVAGEMRAENKGFAADMIETTAINIKNASLKKAAKKLKVVSDLRKMAQHAYDEGDRITGDVVTVTINNITKKA